MKKKEKRKVYLRCIALGLILIMSLNNIGTVWASSDSSVQIREMNQEIPDSVALQTETSSRQQNAVQEQSKNSLEVPSETREVKQAYDIDFYVIIEGKKIKLQKNGISGIKTWTDAKKTYYGISVDDLISVYEEFGFSSKSDSQNSNLEEKFVSANRGKSSIEYGKVYTDIDSGKQYVSYNYGADKGNVPVDVYYLPRGKGGNTLLTSLVKNNNTFYSVEVKGEAQDQIHYVLKNDSYELSVFDYNPKLQERNDRIEWACVGKDDNLVEGVIETEDKTKFTIAGISQSYVIRRADKKEFDINFYVYVDNEIRKVSSASLKKVYRWQNQGSNYIAVSDLIEIYKEYGLTEETAENQFPYALRGEKNLSHAKLEEHKGKKYVSYTSENLNSVTPTDVYYMPKGVGKKEKVPEDQVDKNGTITKSIAEQLKENKNSFYSVTVIQPNGIQNVTYYLKDERVNISIDSGNTKVDEWLCVSGDEKKTIPPVENSQEKKFDFTIQMIEQPYTIACNKFVPETLNIKFYTFVNYQRYNVAQVDVPVLKDTTSKKGTTYYYIKNEDLKKYFEKFHYDGSILNGNSERFYYSKRDYDTLHNGGKYSQNGFECIYIGNIGQPMDVYYLPDGQNAPILNVKTLMEYHDNRYNGFYSVTVQDEDGQVYSPTELENLPAMDFVARKSTLIRKVSTKPRVETQTQEITWECRQEDGTSSSITGIKDIDKQQMSFTISEKDAVRPYVIVPDNTEKPAQEKEANISFYVFIDGKYKLIKNMNATQHFIVKQNSGRTSRYYLRAKADDTISQVYKEFGFTPDKLESGVDGKGKILFGYATDSRVFVEYPYKDNDGTWYIPVLKHGQDVSVYYFSQPSPLNPDKIENYFDRLTGLSAQIGVAGRHFDVEGSFHLVEVIDPLNMTEGKAILKKYVPHHEDYQVQVPKYATLEGTYKGKEIAWNCTANDRNIEDIEPTTSIGTNNLIFEFKQISSSYQIIADKPQEPNTIRIVYDTTRYMKQRPKEEKLTPQIKNKTRFIEDIAIEKAPLYKIKAPYPLEYDHEDNNSKELEQYQFDHWDYRDDKGHWKECDANIELSEILNNTKKPIVFYAAWSRVKNINRKQVQFYICKSAMPEDGSIALPSVNEDDYTSAVAVANCNVKASRVKDVPVLGNKNPTTWEQYNNGHKSVMKLLQGTKADEGYKGDADYIYKLDHIPSDEEVFQTIRESGRKIRIGEKEIPASQLDTEFFTIYWYSFKSVSTDGWHIDGRIVAKNGLLTVKKDFVGNPDAIEQIKKDYFMSIDMDKTFSDGTIQPPAFHQHMKLVLPPENNQTLLKVLKPTDVVGTWDDETHTSCTWYVKVDPFWKYTLKEENYQLSQSEIQFSGWYNVHNSHQSGENVNTWELYPESGIKFTGRGIGRGGEMLTIELENRYQKPGILTLNKFDATSGHGMEDIIFDVILEDGQKKTLTTDRNGIVEIPILLQDDAGNNRTAIEKYILREKNIPIGYVDTGDIEVTIAIKDGTFAIQSAKLIDRKAEGLQGAVTAPPDGKIDGKEVLTLRGSSCLNIRNFSETCNLHMKKTWEIPSDALTEKQVKVRLYQNDISTGFDFLLDETNKWEQTLEKVPLFVDQKPVHYRMEEIEIGKTHYSSEFGDGFRYYEVIYPEVKYRDNQNILLSPTNEEEFRNVKKIELEVQNLHFNLAEKSILKTDNLPSKRLPGAAFMLYSVPLIDGTSDEYVDDQGYTVEYQNGQMTDSVVLKKDGKECVPYQAIPYQTDEKGILKIPDTVANGRYWMTEYKTPDKGNIGKTQYKDNLALYMVDVKDEILFLYEKDSETNEWKALTDRHIVNYPQKNGVTVQITKEVTGPFGEKKKPFFLDISYLEDGDRMVKHVKRKIKHGETVVLPDVKINSEIKIIETVDTLKYDVSLSQKNKDGVYTSEIWATEKKNTAVANCKILGTPGDVIEIKITNKNQEDATLDTGIDLEKKLYVSMLIIISITAVLLIYKRKTTE